MTEKNIIEIEKRFLIEILFLVLWFVAIALLTSLAPNTQSLKLIPDSNIFTDFAIFGFLFWFSLIGFVLGKNLRLRQ